MFHNSKKSNISISGEKTKEVNKNILKLFKKRSSESHKGDFGYLTVIGGSEIYTGAPFLVSSAALRSGCDLVKVVSTKRASNIIASYSPNVITYPYLYDIEKVRGVIISSNALTIGNGMGRSKSVLKFIRSIVKSSEVPKVIDADGIYAVREMKLENSILTPHRKEFEILTGENLMGKLEDDCKLVKENAKRLKCIIVVKGHTDIISDGKDVFINKTGNPYMTKGGTGDVLAGIIGSLIAQGNSLLGSALAGAYICGRAGDIISKEIGPGLLATDIIEKIPYVIRNG